MGASEVDAATGPAFGPPINRRLAVMRRVLSGDALSRSSPNSEQSKRSAARCNSRAAAPTGESRRAPLFPLPPPIEAPSPSFDVSDDEICNISEDSGWHAAKRRRCLLPRHQGSSLVLCGRARPSAATGAQVGARPPPIRTMQSLESFDGSSTPDHLAVACVRSSPSGLRGPTPPVEASRLRGSRGGLHDLTSPAALTGLHARDGVPAMSLVGSSLYVGDETSAVSWAALEAAGVTHILNCTTRPTPLEGEPGAPHHHRLDLVDSVADLPRMPAALFSGVEFIQTALRSGGCVLVHCHRGVSRSATLAIAYLIQATQQPAETVFEAMRKQRRIIDPNLAYWCAIKEWERRVLPPAILAQGSAARGSAAGGSPPPLATAAHHFGAKAAAAAAASEGGECAAPPTMRRSLSRSSSLSAIPAIRRVNSLVSSGGLHASEAATMPVRPLSRAG